MGDMPNATGDQPFGEDRPFGEDQSFEEDRGGIRPDRGGDALVVDLDGYEGPIDVLLTLAREQKVDLAKISILRLVDQYLAFIASARAVSLEIAADYLVVAAWLAYLKSRLLLPEAPADEEPSGPALAEVLQFQLRRLEAMQEAGRKVLALPQLGRDVFKRGAPEGVPVVRRTVFTATLYDLLKAYGDFRGRIATSVLHIEPTTLYTVDDAVRRLRSILPGLPDWATLFAFLPEALDTSPILARSALASTFAATLEMAKKGEIELRQGANFGPIYVRRSRAPLSTPQ